MVSNEYRQQYQTRYVTARSVDGATTADSPILQDNFGVEGQITTLRVFADEVVDLTVDVVPLNDGVDASDGIQPAELGTPETKLHLEGDSQYELGDFENPALETGARVVIQVNLDADLSSSKSVSVNARLDERTS